MVNGACVIVRGDFDFPLETAFACEALLARSLAWALPAKCHDVWDPNDRGEGVIAAATALEVWGCPVECRFQMEKQRCLMICVISSRYD